MESFCPLHVDLEGRECLVIGGGSVAERKVKTMLAYRTRISVVSPSLNPILGQMHKQGNIEYLADIYRPVYLKNKFIVICATNSKEVNRQAAEDCKERGILVNSVSEPDKCNFFLPALLKKGPLTVSVSTAGKSPALARRLRDQLNNSLGIEHAEFARFLGEIRPLVIEKVEDKVHRRALFEKLAGEEFFSKFKRLPRAAIDRKVAELIEAYSREES